MPAPKIPDEPQIAELKKVLGITLNSTEGLLNEKEFKRLSGFANVAEYRKRGILIPVGIGMSATSVSFFYHPRQIAELKKTFGFTLESTQGLLNEDEFIRASGLTRIARYRKQGLITPLGFAMAGPGLSAFYHPRQVTELKKALGITLDSTKGLLNEDEFRKASGLTMTGDYRKKGLITPVGFAMAGTGISAFYHPRQTAELTKALGITLDKIDGLLKENEFIQASGLTPVGKYRKRGFITPVGFAMAGPGISAFYHPRQIAELKKSLGITLESTKGLLNEREFKRESGLTNMSRYRKKGLIKPVGYGLTHGGVSPFYHPRQIAELNHRLAELRSR